MKKILIFIFVILTNYLQAQNPGPFYRQFFFNPYSFNPAFAGINNQADLNLVYRKQWVNFQDAPSTAGISLQIPTSQRVALGFNLLTDRQVLMKNSSFMASFTYIVPLGLDQTLRFGISGGVGMNGLNLGVDELNSNDPVITRAPGNNYYADGNVGVVYTNGGLKVGFALTDIFKSGPFNPETFNKFSFTNLRNRLYSASYRFDLGVAANIYIEPYFLYRETADGLQGYWEAATIINFNQVLWTGAGYNQNNGLALFLGMNVKQTLSFGYSYEFPPFKTTSFSASSHEFQMSYKFGRKLTPPSKVSRMYKRYTNYRGRKPR